MKTTFKLIALMAVTVGLAFASCQKDENNTNGSGNDGGTQGTISTDEWVDMDLPSGLMWASCNVGANAPEGYGNYYAWAETTTKEQYDWSTYNYCITEPDGDGNPYFVGLTKYNTLEEFGDIDNLTTLEAMDDAATMTLGNGARTPTNVEWQELLDNTTSEWTTLNGVRGCKFTASNGNALFLPAAGFRCLSDHSPDGVAYWSSTLNVEHPDYALIFYADNSFYVGGSDRYNGHTVRAVRSAQ